MVGLDEVVLLHISHKDEYLYEKLVDLFRGKWLPSQPLTKQRF